MSSMSQKNKSLIAPLLDEDPTVGRTMRVAAQAAKRGNDEIVKASELIAVVPARGKTLTLAARRMLNLMIQAAEGRAWRGETFEIPKAVLRGTHKGNERITDTIDEIMTTAVLFTTLTGDRVSDEAVPILTRRGIDRGSDDGAMVRFRFSPEVTEMLKHSETYAVLESRAVLGFQSKYGMALYEIGCQLSGRRNPTASLSVVKLRELVNAPAGKLLDWNDFRKRVLMPAQDEIDQLAHFTFEWEEMRQGRKVVGVKLIYALKPGDAAIAAAEEAERHSAGRKARREGSVETVTPPPPSLPSVLTSGPPAASAFPKASISYSEPWRSIAREHGGGWDINAIAAEFRASPAAELTGERLVKAFTTFCKKWAANRKPVS
jgi:hypothetical protein